MTARSEWSTEPIRAPDQATRQLLRRLTDCGCEMRRTGSGHVQVRVPGRAGCWTTGLTPSHAGQRQMFGQVRKHLGIEL